MNSHELNVKLVEEGPDEPFIELENIHKTYLLGVEGVAALRGVDLTIKRGEFVMICGTSGGGKSTMLNIMGTIDKPTKGRVSLCGTKITPRTTDDELAKIRLEHLGFVFQTFNLLSSMTALENVELPLTFRGLGPAKRKELAKSLLESVQMGDRLDHFPNMLSGGEQQRVTIARALANSPELLLLDEPTGDLDTLNTNNVMRILLDLNKKGITMVMVTHDMNLINFGSRVIFMRDGKIASNREITAKERQEKIEELEEQLKLGRDGRKEKLKKEKRGRRKTVSTVKQIEAEAEDLKMAGNSSATGDGAKIEEGLEKKDEQLKSDADKTSSEGKNGANSGESNAIAPASSSVDAGKSQLNFSINSEPGSETETESGSETEANTLIAVDSTAVSGSVSSSSQSANEGMQKMSPLSQPPVTTHLHRRQIPRHSAVRYPGDYDPVFFTDPRLGTEKGYEIRWNKKTKSIEKRDGLDDNPYSNIREDVKVDSAKNKKTDKMSGKMLAESLGKIVYSECEVLEKDSELIRKQREQVERDDAFEEAVMALKKNEAASASSSSSSSNSFLSEYT
ncbi:putative non-transporter ABC protein [Monocercomonoides exilis]|uniref:putative non-transporter ABC protein n=1 Tax=Monocercomonoides exilis TaxID=2049356 RepID=UPI003559E72B|nr:putative non-transporter ABC protein [Monocercomonoides exilis]|eukprot:MONOS_12657.1-p1 / transcript=MONOS_12657.1 / gene=MONOS_12657 / organism=Monocercomonoides_exilis_PA203 / gene_product=putative non-transporter ABC protein / transcript_product=putative non-transporter ABC protein / location=Mono_scaffold00715:18004-19950(-) / protein_length=565 / sequence_SO=supercontig / SO=protein_coding / is_pseudo=false